jgi:hypothetical protein
LHAAWENTRVGLSAGRRGDPEAGREITGHVDPRHVRAAERKKRVRCTLLGAVLTVYAAVMFTRVLRLASGLGWPLPFVLLAAGLITVFTAGSVVVMAGWWSRGNGLGGHLREHGAITGESRAIADDLASQSRAHARASEDAADQAHRQMDLAEQAIQRGYQIVGLGLQKAAKILGQDSVLVPRPENLFPPGRPIRDRVTSNIDRARDVLADAQQLLAATPPFHSAAGAPNPWGCRSAARQAPANPRFVDPDQLGPLHIPDTPATAGIAAWRTPWVRLAVTSGLLAAALATVFILFHG